MMERTTSAVVLLAVALSMPALVRAQDDARRDRLRNPSQLTDTAPDVYRARFDTSKGEFVIEVHRAWAPLAADRFYNLVKYGFYDDVRFFRVLDGFMAQFGLNGDPAIQSAWRTAQIRDEPTTQSNLRGYVTFARAGAPHSRDTQVFINYTDNSHLDPQGFAPFGRVVSGMEVVDELYSGYGRQNVPSQPRIQREGNGYLEKEYPLLDYVRTAVIVE
jgi:peptidyl-prolyl cis-trans isomerase A (cyclophilin A)